MRCDIHHIVYVKRCFHHMAVTLAFTSVAPTYKLTTRFVLLHSQACHTVHYSTAPCPTVIGYYEYLD